MKLTHLLPGRKDPTPGNKRLDLGSIGPVVLPLPKAPTEVKDPSKPVANISSAAGAVAGAVGPSARSQLETLPAAEQPPTVIPSLAAFVMINRGTQLFALYPQLKRLVATAVDRAIREIISPVVDRSVTIACVTTRELIMKDFAMEPDENKIRKAAHQMVQNLTGSLALVTCKEPLRVSIVNHLGALLDQASAQLDRQLVENACNQGNDDRRTHAHTRRPTSAPFATGTWTDAFPLSCVRVCLFLQ
jgi:hypothetical protein